MPFVTAIIPAGGSGQRMGLATPKQFCDLAGLPVLARTLQAFHQTRAVHAIVVVTPAQHLEHTRRLVAHYQLDKVVATVPGGRLRQDSVAAGLAAVPKETELVAVHDGVRPLVSPALIEACLAGARRTGAAMAAIPVKDTLKAVDASGTVVRTVDRGGLWQAQTPQVVKVHLLRQAFRAAAAAGFVGTDEAALLEHLGASVAVVEGSERNLKLTRPEDLLVAEALLRGETQTPAPENLEQLMDQAKDKTPLRIGHGYDAHQLVAGRPLVLGGVTIPHSKGLLGHSDADVLTHALCDAILGAVGEGDIGRHFPDSEDRFRGIASLQLLQEVIVMAGRTGLGLVNADITVVAQRPKLAAYFPAMKEKLAAVCRCRPEAINLKASTTEKMGFAGREEGMAAHAVVLLARD